MAMLLKQKAFPHSDRTVVRNCLLKITDFELNKSVLCKVSQMYRVRRRGEFKIKIAEDIRKQ